MSDKNIKKFINKFVSKIRYPIDKIKLIHQLLIQLDENPYRLFFSWLLDVLQYGLLIQIVITWFFGFDNLLKFIVGIIPLGILYWLWFDLVSQTKNKIIN